jgi:hypothetical protein
MFKKSALLLMNSYIIITILTAIFISVKITMGFANATGLKTRLLKKLLRGLIPDLVFENMVLPYLDIYPLSTIAEDIGVTEDLLKLRLEK